MYLALTTIRSKGSLAVIAIRLLRTLAAGLTLATAGAIPAQAALCVESGGTDICTKPVVKSDWTYGAGDCVAPFLWRSALWCDVRGGTWDATPVNGPVCVNPGPWAEFNISSWSSQFEQRAHNACQMGVADTGWTAHVMPGGMCEDWEQRMDGVVVTQPRDLHFTGMSPDANGACTSAWSEHVIALRSRDVGCPQGMRASSDPIKGAVCVKVPPCEKCLGNPVDPDSGAKLQREPDYVFGGTGGLAFERFYNSQGYFSRVERSYRLDDFWRHTYQGEIVPITDITGFIAAARRPEGTTKYFRTDGRELHNVAGGAYRLEKLVDGGGATTGWRLTTDASDVELYDAQGRLASITRRSGHAHTLAYDGNGRIQSVTDSFGRALQFAYDPSDRLSTLTDPAGRTYAYGYDATGRLVTVTHPGNVTRTYLYEDTSHPWGLTGIVDEGATRLSTYSYNADGRVASTERAGQENRFTFSYPFSLTTPRTTTVYDAFGVQRTYDFQTIGGATKMTREYLYTGSETRSYDANGNLASKTDRRGYVTTYVYDAVRNLESSRTEASGTALARTIATTWHPTFRLPAQITEPSGVAGVNLVTAFAYDAAGNLTQKTQTAGALTRQWNYTYDAYGQALTVNGPRTDAVDVTTMTYYPANDACVGCRGQLWTVTNAAGHVVTFNAYSADGRPTQITDANGAVTAMTYTPRGWLESRTAAGETTAFQYDEVGNLTRVTLPDGSWIAYTYDAANALVAVNDRLGNSIQYELDVMGNRVEERVLDPQGALKKGLYRVYDGGNRLFREIGSQGQTTEYTYSDLLPTTVRDPLYRATSNYYDAFGRL
ncbi:MAG: RHS repeat protein, partial [Burkholderiales bacterium]|nr:RHS repeat protein [Burkholderiales bacterium]